MLLIYTPKITNRVSYTFKLIFEELLGVAYEVTDDKESFIATDNPKMSYAPQPVADELFLQSHNLLTESGITEQNIVVSEWEGIKTFFSTGKRSALPFDPFAASFFMVSRYEECLPHIRDKYDRFEAKESVAYKYNFLQKPLVNIYALKIREILGKQFSGIKFKENKYRYISTLDIDNAYAYLHKGMFRTLGAYLRDIIKLDFATVVERTKVLFGQEKDPYDTYNFQLNIHKKYHLESIYFFLVADYGLNDKNVPHYNSSFQSLVKSIADYAQVGVHPSFGSNLNPEKVKVEIQRLSKILHGEITKSRQHFLILHLPKTYRNLINYGITDDFSMGYAAEAGFRAGICSSFNYYDLETETETNLRIHPFAVMEATLKYYMEMTPDEAIRHIDKLIEEVKAVNGTFISLWHNETLSDKGIWKGWRKVYEAMVKKAVPGDD